MSPDEYAAHVRRQVEQAPPIPADAVDLLRRMGCPATQQRDERRAS